MISAASNIATKTLGVIGLGLVAYDSHIRGSEESHEFAKKIKADSITKHYLDEMSLENPSVVREEVKKQIFNYRLDENFSSFFTGIAGYCKGFTEMLVKNVIPFGLAVGTFIGSKGIRGGISKCCGLGLLVYGGIFLAQEIFGIGKTNE